MAKNPPPGPGRSGEVKKRDQVYSPQNKRWTKRDADKKFMDQMTKKIVLFISLGICSIVLVLFLINKIQGPCSATYFDFSGAVPTSTNVIYCDKAVIDFVPEVILQSLAFILLLLLSLLFLSLITYKMKDEVFQAWWRFARWWVLVIIAATLFLQNAGGGGGLGISGAVGGAFDALILGILYAILVITSLVKILRAYLRTKN